MPGALALVFILLLIVAFFTWIIPTSVVINDNGENKIVYNARLLESGEILTNSGPSPVGLWGIILAIVEGFALSSSIGFTIFISGSFLAIMNYTGALDAIIGFLLKKFTGNFLISALMLVFALMGTVYGSWEELPAYALIIVPLFVVAGYDVITGISVLFFGATVGNMSSIVNPYSTGAAVAAIGNSELSLGSGILLRIIVFVILYIVSVISVIKYASKVKKEAKHSVVYNIPGIKTLTDKKSDLVNLNKSHLISIFIFILMIILLVMGYVPWSSMSLSNGKTMYDVVNYPFVFLSTVPFINNLLDIKSITYFGDWYFNEFSIVFILGSIAVAIVNKIPLDDFLDQIVTGAKDLMSVVLVLSVARGMSVVMGDSEYGISVTLVYWIQTALSGVPIWGFSIACVAAYLLIGLFLQSTSGVSAITMPILGAVAAALFATSSIGSTSGQIVLISSLSSGLGFMSAIYPGATIMGVLDMVNVPYNIYLKYALKQLLPLLIINILILSLLPLLGIV